MAISPAPLVRGTPSAWVVYAFLLVAVSVACFGSLSAHLLDIHDQEIFEDCRAISKDFSYFFLPADQKEVGSGRPMSDLIRWLAFEIWGEAPGPFHLLVVAVHTLASLLLARLAWRLGTDLELSLMGGLFFLTNVAHFQAVHWISALDYSLALVWGLSAVLCYLGYLRTAKKGWLWAFYLVLFFVSMTHLAMLLIWPFCAYWSWQTGRDLRVTLRQLLPFGLILLPTLALIFYLTADYTSTSQSLVSYAHTNLLARLTFMVRLLLWFLSRLLTTAHWLLVPVYEKQLWEMFLGLGVLVSLGWFMWKKIFPVNLWALWTIATLLPFLLMTEDIVFDLQPYPARYLYFSSAGSSLIIAWLLERSTLRLGRYLRPWIARIGLTGILLAISYVNLKRTEALSFYSSARYYISAGNGELGVAHFQRAIAQAPEVIPLQDAYIRLSMHLIGTPGFNSLIEEALKQFPDEPYLKIYNLVSQSMTANPSLQDQAFDQLEELVESTSDAQKGSIVQIAAQGYHNLAMSLQKRGDLERAATAYKLSLRFYPEYLISYNRLGAVLMKLDRPLEAEEVYRQGILHAPDNPQLYHNLGRAQIAIGDRQGAIAAFEKALSLGSDHLETYIGLGWLYRQNGRTAEIITLYDRALHAELKDTTSPLYTKMGDELLALDRADLAGIAYRCVLERDPDNLTATVNLGWCCYLKGDLQEAIAHYRQALALQPNSQAQFNLGLTYLRLGQMEQARQAYAEGVEKYGAAEAEKIGAVDDLKQLIGQGIQVAEAQRLLNTYWQ